MLRNITKSVLLGLTLALLPALSADVRAATTEVSLSTDAYTDLGAGPFYLGAETIPVIYLTGASLPAANAQGFPLQPGATVQKLDTAAHVYARAARAGAKVLVSTDVLSPTGSVVIGAALPAGTNEIGSVKAGASFQLSPTAAVQAAAYSAGNAVGGLLTANGAARVAGGSGTLMGLRISVESGASGNFWVYAWSKLPTSTCNDRAAFVRASADSDYLLPGFPFSINPSSPAAWDAGTVGSANFLSSQFRNQDSPATTAIYVCVVSTGTFTPASTTDVKFGVSGIQD